MSVRHVSLIFLLFCAMPMMGQHLLLTSASDFQLLFPSASERCLLSPSASDFQFSLIKECDSLSFVVLENKGSTDRWRLPYVVYRFCTGDVNGDGQEEALVGVIKPTRFYPQPGRRIFIFKNHRGLIRPLWLGSKLGGDLVDFQIKDGKVRGLEQAGDGSFFVAEYRWRSFGLKFDRYLVKGVQEDVAKEIFNQ